jgi:hypothetical protein
MVGSSRALLAAVALTVGFAGCKKKDAPPVPKVDLTPESAVPAPSGLMIEAVVRSPDAIVQSFRTITPLVPDRAAPLLADALHVSRETTDEVDGQKPAYFALVRRNGESGYVLALHVRDAGKVLVSLAKQGLARTEDPSQGLSIFEAGQTSTGPRGQVLGVRRNFLIAASTVSTLRELAPFATRTLPTRPVPQEDVFVTVPQSAMRGEVRDALRSALEAAGERRKQAAATGSDAGIARSATAIDAIVEYATRSNERLVSWLGDAGDAHMTVVTRAGSVSIRGDIDVANAASPFGQQIESWPVGDASAALRVPAAALIAFVGRSSATARTEASRDLVDMLATTYPADVGEKEKAKLEEFLAAWDAARGDLTSGALLYEGPARIAIAARLSAKDPAALAKLTREAMASILAIKGVAQGLIKEGIGVPRFSTATLAGTHVDVLSLKLPQKPGEKPAPGEPETADIVFGVVPGSSDVALIAGVGSKDLFPMFIDTRIEKTLQSFPALSQQVQALGSSLAGFALGLPNRTLPLASGAEVKTPAPPEDPVAIAIGKGPKGPFLSMDVSRNAVELAGRFAMSAMLKK